MTRRFCRFVSDSVPEPRFGEVLDSGIRALSQAPWHGQGRPGEVFDLDAVALQVPLLPSKIVCVGRNYADHAAELGNAVPQEPLLFLKAPSSLLPHKGEIRLPRISEQVEYEGEIGIVVGRRAKDLSDSDDPKEYIFGFTCVNDVTARDVQRRDVQFTRGKSFDTFCPVGPFVVLGLEHETLALETLLNGVVRQRGRPEQMVFPIPFLVTYISRMMTLEPGDLIATGTPSGVGKLAIGDTVEVRVSGIGSLTNQVL